MRYVIAVHLEMCSEVMSDRLQLVNNCHLYLIIIRTVRILQLYYWYSDGKEDSTCLWMSCG